MTKKIFIVMVVLSRKNIIFNVHLMKKVKNIKIVLNKFIGIYYLYVLLNDE